MKFKYKLFLTTLIICSSLFVFTNVEALSMGRVTNEDGVTIRSGPGTNYSKSGTLSYNDVVPLLSTSKEPGTKGCSSGWYKISYNGPVKYACSSYFSTSTITVNVNESGGVNLRNGAGTNYAIYKQVNNDKPLTLVSSSKIKGTGCSKGWYKVNYNGMTKYICSNYTDNYNNTSNVIVTQSKGTILRSGAKSSSSAIATINYGQALTLVSKTTYSGTGCSKGWYKVYYKGTNRYVCSNHVLNTNINGSLDHKTGTSIRSGNSTKYRVVTKLKYNTKVNLVSTTKYKGTGCSAGWYKIKLDGYYRYVCSSYVSTSSLSTNVTGSASVNIRSGAGVGYKKVDTLNNGSYVILVNTTKYKGTGCSSGWYKIRLNGYNRYICSSYTTLGKTVKNSSSSNSTSNGNSSANTDNTNNLQSQEKTLSKVSINSSIYYYTTNKWTYKINENYATVRKSPDGDVKEYIYLGTEVKPLKTSGSYTQISYFNGRTGWVFTRLIDKYSNVTKTDSTYCAQLKKSGFPESYCPYLSFLHSKHPNWTFKAEKTNDTFNNAVYYESQKNYTELNISAYIASSTLREKPNWRSASDAYNAYMLDPRNYLNEKNIYVFEDLSYNSQYHTKNNVRNVVDGTYLDTDEYAKIFVETGKSHGISPIHLASRIKQEGGTDKTYTGVSGTVSSKWQVTSSGYVCTDHLTKKGSTLTLGSGTLNVRSGAGTDKSILKYPNGNKITMTNKDSATLVNTTKYKGAGCTNGWYKVKVLKSLKGYYNFYNIGAYGDNPVLRGVAAAAGFVDDLEGTPWNTEEKAINYGAKFIASQYINLGQDTLFYQKFNVGPKTNNKYTHQYMTNIIAPASESLSTYYLDNNSTQYVFKIPVYNNMPTNPTSHPPVNSITSHLNTLK